MIKKELIIFLLKKYEWHAYQQGPLISDTYIGGPGNKDLIIELNWDNWSVNEQHIFKRFWFSVNGFETIRLIRESHRTDPWTNNYKVNSIKSIIRTDEIIKWFKINPPFFVIRKKA